MFPELGKVLISHFEKFTGCEKIYAVVNNQFYLQMAHLLPFKNKIMLNLKKKITIIRNHVFTYKFGGGVRRRKTTCERVNC